MKAPRNNNTLGVLCGVLSAVFVAGYITVNKYVYSHYNITALDYSILFAICGGLFGLLSGLRHLDRATLQSLRSNLSRLVILGLAGSLAVGMFTFGQHYTSTINAALIMTATIVATSVFSYLLLGEQFSRRQWQWALVLFVGLYIGIVGVHSVDLHSGDLIVLASVVFFGFGNAFSRVVMRTMKRPGIVPDVRLFFGGLVAVLAGIIAAPHYPEPATLLPFALLGGLFYWLCMKTFALSVHLLNANEAIVLNNSQIFFTSVAGVLILAQDYSLEQFIGSVIALVSIFFITRHKGRVRTAAPSEE